MWSKRIGIIVVGPLLVLVGAGFWTELDESTLASRERAKTLD